ncbi:MAG: endolytic transglycosylase MltG [Myxococcota bacterium]
MRALWLTGTLAVTLGTLLLLAEHGRSLLEPVSTAPAPQLFEVSAGTSFASVARRLEQGGLIRSARMATFVARYNGMDGQLHVGEYELSPDQSTREVLEAITTGQVKTWRVTVPEGSRAEDIALRLEASGLVSADTFRSALRNTQLANELGVPSRDFEGYLFPDTYQLPRGLEAEQMVRLLVGQFETVWQKQIQPLSEDSRLSKHEIVTLASIVEKETASPAERPLIAAVFLNRLKLGMRLETDPAVIYGIPEFDGNLRRRHLNDVKNLYNTYQHTGLPPGPIASPGQEALQSVVEPEETDYLYFVSKNDGTHQFSKTYAEHQKAVNRFQRSRR